MFNWSKLTLEFFISYFEELYSYIVEIGELINKRELLEKLRLVSKVYNFILLFSSSSSIIELLLWILDFILEIENCSLESNES